MSSLREDFEVLARELSSGGFDCVLERFRLPTPPRLTPPAGFLAASASAFCVAAGRGAAAFLLATLGTILLFLDDRGFSPLDWLGRKRSRTVLVVRGTPSSTEGTALFFGLPLRCRLAGNGYYSRGESARRGLHAAGMLLCAALWAASAALLLLYLPPLPLPGAVAGVALLSLSVLEGLASATSPGPENRAPRWAARLAASGGERFVPHLLVYSGDPEEVKYFLARHRGALFRGTGLFLEFPSGANGPPALSVREGPLLPYRVDAGLVSRIRSAGDRSGAPPFREEALRYKSPALFSMARGFLAATLFRREGPPGEGAGYGEETAAAWAAAVASRWRAEN